MEIIFDAAIRPGEQDYVEQVKAVTALLNERFDFKITHLRFARKPKAFGSDGTADFHRYTYGSQPGKIEIWVNLAHGVMTIESMALAIASSCLWSANRERYERDNKSVTKAMMEARDPEGKYLHNKVYRISTLHDAFMKSDAVLARLHGPLSIETLLDMTEA